MIRTRDSEGHKTTVTEWVKQADSHYRFGVKDRFGRELGAHVILGVHVFTSLVPGEDCLYFHRAPGRYFSAHCMATRNGNIYRLPQPWSHFDTEAKRSVHVAKYLKAALARAQKAATR